MIRFVEAAFDLAFNRGRWGLNAGRLRQKGIRLLAATTNGTSAIVAYRGRKYYVYYDHALGQFVAELVLP